VSTLRGRIGLALIAFGLTTLLVVGGSLWVALRDLHRDAALGAMTELTVPYATFLRSPSDGQRGVGGPAARLRSGALAAGDSTLAAFIDRIQEDVDPASLSVILIEGRTADFLNPSEGTTTTLADPPSLGANLTRGQVATGSTTIHGLGDVVYAATPIVVGPRGRTPLTLMLARHDDSAELATADLARALTLAGLALLIIGIPIAVGLGASVARPLRRLSAATETVAAGGIPEPLPIDGPMEVADASAAFNAMAAEVGATRETQRQLLADIRHDLRTPLTVIGGFSEALRDGTASGDAAIRAADAISDETARLGRMLDDLDHLTMPGMAQPSLHLEMVDGRDLALAAVARFDAEATSRGQSIILAPDAVSAELSADRDALDRILGNLIANALVHAPSPGGVVQLEVALLDDGRQSGARATGSTSAATVRIAVRDDGPGIPSSALPHIFDRFYRADPSRASRGSGLGLAIVADLAEALGGRAFAENPTGGGARVGIEVPRTA
jgi:two-component system, OmpR family, sensor histidine kinase BaeS